MKAWFDNTYWIHYHPKSDFRQVTDGFGDCPHHTGFYITARLLNNTLTDKEANLFKQGYNVRNKPDGFARHPRTILPDGNFEMCNRDQLTPLLYPLERLVSKEAAEEVYKKTKLYMWPHQWLHFQRSMNKKVLYPIRVLCDSLEIIDTLLDLIFHNGSSGIKSIYRIKIANIRQPTFMSKLNSWLINKLLKPKEIFKEYFTYKHNEEDSPPPIHIEWDNIL